jgi:hypothetical protein
LSLLCGEQKGRIRFFKYWEIIADNLSKAGWIWGCVSAIDSTGQRSGLQTHIANNGKGFVAHAEEKLTAFLELESAIGAVSGH